MVRILFHIQSQNEATLLSKMVLGLKNLRQIAFIVLIILKAKFVR